MRSNPSIVVFGAALLAGLATVGSARAGSLAPARPAPWFTDGARRVEVERLGRAEQGASGRALAPVRLRYEDGRTALAHVGPTAIVEVEPGAEGALAAAGLAVARPLMPSIGLFLVTDAGGGDGLALAERLRDRAARPRGLREVVPDLYLRLRAHAAPFTPDDPRLPGQWYFHDLRMEEAWGLTLGDAETSIVIVDNGCDLDHPDLAPKLDPGRDVIDGDDDPTYVPGEVLENHGTACAGLAAAATNNGEGIAGGCPACRLRCVRMLDEEAQPISAMVEVFQFALEVNAAVVSNSWGFAEPGPVPRVVEDAINHLVDTGRNGRGALVLFAAGNEDREIEDDEIHAVRGVLTVGAVNHLEEETQFTNRGRAVDIVAPTGTLTTDITGSGGDDPTDYTSSFGGTSAACPVAAGIAGLLASAAPDKTSSELYDILTRTARRAPYALPDETGHDPVFGYGIIDPVAALREVIVEEPPPLGDKGGGPRKTDDDAGCACAEAPGAAPGGWLGAHAAGGGLLLALARVRRRRAKPSSSPPSA